MAQATRTLVVGPYLNKHAQRASAKASPPRDPQDRLLEAASLTRAIQLEVVDAFIATLSALTPATYMGSGKVAEIAERVEAEEIALVVMDCALSPVQQRNLEKALGAKVIDRTGLILEIFGQRARTREGALQVELAHLAYQKSRLVRSWTHLERQRGGFGFLGGPGETQIETDRRLIEERMARIERDLAGVKRTRALHRKARRDVPYPVVALVGYTNAGKSTLFNALTQSDVFAKDLLFATLDPTLRALRLPHGGKVILSDTVGFISDLPTLLISAFRATLEEVLEADVIVHVRDISHADSDAQSADVTEILQQLGIDSASDIRRIEVWNKADLLAPHARTAAVESASHAATGVKPADMQPILISALTGEGLPELLAAIEARLAKGRVEMHLKLDASDGQGLSWLYENTEILARQEDGKGDIDLRVRVLPQMRERLERRFPGVALM
ncbi:MAG: GTPase HflX [Hyphomicrobiales bacterium]|nr:GTPase HflX [Hyphomicrobiales bacterium]MDE2113290.1 GTPase HflX [Hyphomicrobiales bacterium]